MQKFFVRAAAPRFGSCGVGTVQLIASMQPCSAGIILVRAGYIKNQQTKIIMNITLAQAQTALEAALAKATDIKVKMNVAIVDSGANLVAFARQDNAWLGSKDIAMKKAKTAVFFQMPSGDLGKLSQPGDSLYGIEVSNDGLISFGGGFPIMNEQKEVIGAIGVSGGVVKQDEEVAKAGLKALGKS